MTKVVRVQNIKIGGKNPMVVIAGPCVIESETNTLSLAQALKDITTRLKIPFIFKASYDKANRSSISSYRGPGLVKGLKILKKVKDKFKIPILSDVHCKSDLKEANAVLDIIQIPAFLSRQTDFIIEAAKTKKIINIKKGQFLAPWDIKNVIEKIEHTGNKNIIITERGVSFGYNNLVSDMRSLPIMRAFGYPVIFDATHSVQLPGGEGKCSGGEREFVSTLAKAATAVGCEGLFLEVHQNPDKALCDGPNSINLKMLEGLLKKIKQIEKIVQDEK